MGRTTSDDVGIVMRYRTYYADFYFFTVTVEHPQKISAYESLLFNRLHAFKDYDGYDINHSRSLERFNTEWPTQLKHFRMVKIPTENKRNQHELFVVGDKRRQHEREIKESYRYLNYYVETLIEVAHSAEILPLVTATNDSNTAVAQIFTDIARKVYNDPYSYKRVGTSYGRLQDLAGGGSQPLTPASVEALCKWLKKKYEAGDFKARFTYFQYSTKF